MSTLRQIQRLWHRMAAGGDRMSEVFKWFGDAGNAAFVASLLSITAIIVSILAFRKSLKTQNRLVDIEEAREKDRLAEKNKANLTAKITKEELRRSSTSRIHWQYHLVVENKGLSEARDIRIWLDGKQVSDHPAFVKDQEEIFIVGPQSQFKYHIVKPFPSGIAIAWSDDSGEVSSYRSSLTL